MKITQTSQLTKKRLLLSYGNRNQSRRSNPHCWTSFGNQLKSYDICEHREAVSSTPSHLDWEDKPPLWLTYKKTQKSHITVQLYVTPPILTTLRSFPPFRPNPSEDALLSLVSGHSSWSSHRAIGVWRRRWRRREWVALAEEDLAKGLTKLCAHDAVQDEVSWAVDEYEDVPEVA